MPRYSPAYSYDQCFPHVASPEVLTNLAWTVQLSSTQPQCQAGAVGGGQSRLDVTLQTWDAGKQGLAWGKLRLEQEEERMPWLRGGHRWLGVLCVIGLLIGCASTPEQRSTGEVIDDAAITTKVKTNLLADPIVSSFAISVETARGVVSLTGIVNSPGERTRAIQVTQGTGGVRRVDARNLFVKQ
jgi:hypothetical protein